MLNSIRDFLLPFHDATKASEGRSATLDRVLPTMDFLLEVFEEGLGRYEPGTYMRASIQTGYVTILTFAISDLGRQGLFSRFSGDQGLETRAIGVAVSGLYSLAGRSILRSSPDCLRI